MVKACVSCGIEKSLSEFSIQRKRKDGRRAKCKECLSSVAKLEYPTKQRNTNLLRQYGISLEDYESLAVSQGNLCKICQNPETILLRGKVMPLAVDHNHTSGKVRGLLCLHCNQGLGHFKDSIELLKNAIQYLEENDGQRNQDGYLPREGDF